MVQCIVGVTVYKLIKHQTFMYVILGKIGVSQSMLLCSLIIEVEPTVHGVHIHTVLTSRTHVGTNPIVSLSTGSWAGVD